MARTQKNRQMRFVKSKRMKNNQKTKNEHSKKPSFGNLSEEFKDKKNNDFDESRLSEDIKMKAIPFKLLVGNFRRKMIISTL